MNLFRNLFSPQRNSASVAKERLKIFAGLRLTPTITVDPNDGTVSFSFDARAAKEDEASWLAQVPLEHIRPLARQGAGQHERWR